VRAIDFTLPVISLLFLTILLIPRIRDSHLWRACVTPLASIIGSGFLIVVPLLGEIVGPGTPWVMLLIVAVAYLIGGVIRFNIRFAESVEDNRNATTIHQLIEHISNLGLLGAYVISIAFYLRLMSAFLLRGVGQFTETNANLLTTAVLMLISTIGWRRGLKTLERIEEYSVSLKLAIIASFLIALAAHAMTITPWVEFPPSPDTSIYETARLLAGMLLVVQGFETSRYLGRAYSADTRIRSMRLAQFLSAGIYIAFAFLMLPLLHFLPIGKPDETAIIDLSRHVSIVLPTMLIIAAVMSQFSAAVADTLGGGGLVSEESRTRITPGIGYLVIAAAAIALIWSTSIFEIVAYASRAFAFYYFAQTLLALHLAWRGTVGWHRWFRLTGFGLMAIALAWVVLFARSVG